jgi:hypothetical protein
MDRPRTHSAQQNQPSFNGQNSAAHVEASQKAAQQCSKSKQKTRIIPVLG